MSKQFKQGTILAAKMGLSIGNISAKRGDLFVITSPFYKNIKHSLMARKKGAKINQGIQINNEDILEFFEELEQ